MATKHERSRRARLARLRALIAGEKDLVKPLNYFLKHLASDPGFMDQSKPGDPGLDAILQGIGAQLLGPDMSLGGQCFLRYGPLWHGGSVFGATMATVLYDGEHDIGIMAVPVGGKTALIRFTLLPVGMPNDPRRRPS